MTDMIKPLDEPESNGTKATQEDLEAAAKCLNVTGQIPTLIEPDDEFEFECQQCGACCINRHDIILNPFDIYTAAKYLNMSCSDFMVKYTDRILGGSSKIPMVILQSDKSNGFCPFLDFDYIHDGKFKCSINPAKPGACRSHPIGLISKCDMDDHGELKSIDTSFIKVEQCDQSKTGKKQKVKDWMQYYTDHKESVLRAHKLSIMTNSILDWRKLFFMVSVFAVASENKKIPHENEMMTQGFNVLANIMIGYTYANYDINKPFDEQCDENYVTLRNKFNEMSNTMVAAMKSVFLASCHMPLEEAIKLADKEGFEETILDFGSNRCCYEGCSVPTIEEMQEQRKGGDSNGNPD